MTSSTLLDMKKAIEMVDGDPALYKMLLNAFINEAPFHSDYLLGLLEKQNRDEAAKYIHRIKGASAQLGAEKLAAAGQTLENVLRGKAEGDLDVLVDSFISVYEETLPLLKEALGSL